MSRLYGLCRFQQYRQLNQIYSLVSSLKMSTSTSTSSPPPPISHILETCLYVRDINASADFYTSTLNIEPFIKSPRMTGFSLGATTLLLFQLGLTSEDSHVNSGKTHGVIPGHGPRPSSSSSSSSTSSTSSSDNKNDSNVINYRLNQHFCLAVQTPLEVQQWDTHLQNRGVRILGRMDWDLGGKSVYFEDLDGHVGEIGSRGIWQHY